MSNIRIRLLRYRRMMFMSTTPAKARITAHGTPCNHSGSIVHAFRAQCYMYFSISFLRFTSSLFHTLTVDLLEIYRDPSTCGPRRFQGRAEKKSHVDRPINKATFGPHLERAVQNYTPIIIISSLFLGTSYRFAPNGQIGPWNLKNLKFSAHPSTFTPTYNKSQTCQSSKYMHLTDRSVAI
jgi:hypothetical protein